MLIRTPSKTPAILAAALLFLGSATAATQVRAADTVESATPLAGHAVAPPDPEATKLRVALAEIEVEMAKVKLDFTQRKAAFIADRAKTNAATPYDVDEAKAESDLAALSLKAAEIMVAQARLGPDAPAPSLPDVDSAKLQIEVAQVQRSIALVKLKQSETALARIQAASNAAAIPQSDVDAAKSEVEMSKLFVQLGEIHIAQAKHNLDRAAKSPQP